MPFFKTINSLKQSLNNFGLEGKANDIIASSRPCIRFLRSQVPDDDTRILSSRMGGLPALPLNWQWPIRPAFPDAEIKAKQLDADHQEKLRIMDADTWKQAWEKTCEDMRDHLPTNEFDKMMAMECPYTSELIESIEQEYTALRNSLFTGMPLTFIAQLNLDELSSYEGFDKALPSTGMLLFFEDPMDLDHPGQILHIANTAQELKRRPFPAELLEWNNVIKNKSENTIELNTECEVLKPCSAISVPHHWCRPEFSPRIEDWIWESSDELFLRSNGEKESSFGDQLAGWPEDVQDHPEFNMAPNQALFQPADTPWRMIFSYSCERFEGTRLLPLGGDGQVYWMIHQGSLVDGEWGKARPIYQCT